MSSSQLSQEVNCMFKLKFNTKAIQLTTLGRYLCLSLLLTCAKEKGPKAPSNDYATQPYSPLSLSSPEATEVLFVTDAWHLPRTLNPRATTWDKKTLPTQTNTHDTIAERELQILWSSSRVNIEESNAPCGQADSLLAWLASALSFSVDHVAVVGDFSNSGQLVCRDLEKAISDRTKRGAKYIFIPRSAEGISSEALIVQPDLIKIVSRLGGPDLSPSNTFKPWTDLSALEEKAKAETTLVIDKLKPFWPSLIEMSNGAGVTEDQSRASKHVLFNAEKAQTLEAKNNFLASLMYWDQAEAESSRALNSIPPIASPKALSKAPKTLAEVIQRLDTKLFEAWYPSESFPRWTRIARDHALRSNLKTPATMRLLDNMKPFVDKALISNPLDSEGALELTRQKSMDSILRASSISGEEPGLARYLFHTSEQLEGPLSLKRSLYQHARLAAESYVVLMLRYAEGLKSSSQGDPEPR